MRQDQSKHIQSIQNVLYLNEERCITVIVYFNTE